MWHNNVLCGRTQLVIKSLWPYSISLPWLEKTATSELLSTLQATGGRGVASEMKKQTIATALLRGMYVVPGIYYAWSCLVRLSLV